MIRNTLSVLIQAFPENIHPISKKIISTAAFLGRQKGYRTAGAIFISSLSDELKAELEESQLDEIFVFEDECYNAFIPENEAKNFCRVLGEKSDVVLVPATPEGRTLSSQIAAMLKTGVTADCTELRFDEEGLLVQTRPAFSGNIMASIVTKEKRPQIASLRFGEKIEKEQKKTKLIFEKSEDCEFPYEASWLDRVRGEELKQSDIIIAIGGGIKQKEDIEKFYALAQKLGAKLYSSRMLVDRGFMQRKNQIGLSGNSVRAKTLITFGISGSLQFRAGLENIEKLISVNTDAEAPIMKIADVALIGDMYEICDAMLKI